MLPVTTTASYTLQVERRVDSGPHMRRPEAVHYLRVMYSAGRGEMSDGFNDVSDVMLLVSSGFVTLCRSCSRSIYL